MDTLFPLTVQVEDIGARNRAPEEGYVAWRRGGARPVAVDHVPHVKQDTFKKLKGIITRMIAFGFEKAQVSHSREARELGTSRRGPGFR
jgi:hypothetical protein